MINGLLSSFKIRLQNFQVEDDFLRRLISDWSRFTVLAPGRHSCRLTAYFIIGLIAYRLIVHYNALMQTPAGIKLWTLTRVKLCCLHLNIKGEQKTVDSDSGQTMLCPHEYKGEPKLWTLIQLCCVHLNMKGDRNCGLCMVQLCCVPLTTRMASSYRKPAGPTACILYSNLTSASQRQLTLFCYRISETINIVLLYCSILLNFILYIHLYFPW